MSVVLKILFLYALWRIVAALLDEWAERTIKKNDQKEASNGRNPVP